MVRHSIEEYMTAFAPGGEARGLAAKSAAAARNTNALISRFRRDRLPHFTERPPAHLGLQGRLKPWI